MSALAKEIFRKNMRSAAWFHLTVYKKKKKRDEREELKNEPVNVKEPGLAGFENKAIFLLASPDGIQFSNQERAASQRSTPDGTLRSFVKTWGRSKAVPSRTFR